MKKLLFIFLIISISNIAFCQEDTISLKELNLEMLTSPTNPAFLLMNTSPTEIVEPGSMPEFYTTIQNSSNNFSAIPNNYGFSITPFWWGKEAKRLSFDNDFSTSNKLNFWRTTTFSGGIVQGIGDNNELWRYGLGFQTTLLRGKVDKTKKDLFLSELRKYHNNYFKDIYSYFAQNAEYQNLLTEEKVLSETIVLKIKNIDTELKRGDIDSTKAYKLKIEITNELKSIQDSLSSLKNELAIKFEEDKESLNSNKNLDNEFSDLNNRIGIKWDIGGGCSASSQGNKIDSTNIYRLGFWSNFGGDLLTSKSKKSSLAGYLLVKYLFYKEINYENDEGIRLLNNVSTLDIGGKLNYDINNKFSLAFEGIYRLGLSSDIYDDTYKINGIAQYVVQKNRIVYLSIGNNFNDNSDYGPEDLIVTIGVNIGLGSNIDLYDIVLPSNK